MYFGSDNESPAHPNIMQALIKANEGYATSYGADPIMNRVRSQVRDYFEAPDAAVYLVATGSTANVLSLATYVDPWQAIYCHPRSHINTDECNAPEFFTGGAKLILVDGENGKITPESLRKTIRDTPQGDVHAAQRGIVSITNLSEAGTMYTPAQVAALSAIARQNDIPFHMDGARFLNALVAADCTPAEMTWKSGVDLLSFGGTKNGLMGVEAVVMFDAANSWEFELRRKRAGHLLSKHRYLSAQMEAYLDGGLCIEMATNANKMAARLSQGIMAIPGASLMYPTDGNIVFANMTRHCFRMVKQAGSKFYFTAPEMTIVGPDEEILSARFVCSWSTTAEDVDQFLSLAQS